MTSDLIEMVTPAGNVPMTLEKAKSLEGTTEHILDKEATAKAGPGKKIYKDFAYKTVSGKILNPKPKSKSKKEAKKAKGK